MKSKLQLRQGSSRMARKSWCLCNGSFNLQLRNLLVPVPLKCRKSNRCSRWLRSSTKGANASSHWKHNKCTENGILPLPDESQCFDCSHVLDYLFIQAPSAASSGSEGASESIGDESGQCERWPSDHSRFVVADAANAWASFLLSIQGKSSNISTDNYFNHSGLYLSRISRFCIPSSSLDSTTLPSLKWFIRKENCAKFPLSILTVTSEMLDITPWKDSWDRFEKLLTISPTRNVSNPIITVPLSLITATETACERMRDKTISERKNKNESAKVE